jgi:hypothetical protein
VPYVTCDVAGLLVVQVMVAPDAVTLLEPTAEIVGGTAPFETVIDTGVAELVLPARSAARAPRV